MRKLVAILAIALAVPLAACGERTQNVESASSVPAERVVHAPPPALTDIGPAAKPGLGLTAMKAHYAAEAAYHGALTAAEFAVDHGQLKGASARKVHDLLDDAGVALTLARGAEKIGDAETLSAKATAVLDLVAQAAPLIPALAGDAR